MSKFFKKNKKKAPITRKKEEIPAEYRTQGPLVDPVAYSGDLDEKIYPILPIEVDKTKKVVEDVENPLNKR